METEYSTKKVGGVHVKGIFIPLEQSKKYSTSFFIQNVWNMKWNQQ